MTLPAVDTLDTYGGELSDYRPVVDPTTDRAAAAANQAYASTAAATHVVPRAVVRVTQSGAALTVAFHDAVWGDSLAVKPTATYNSAGNYTVTWDTEFEDELGTEHTTNFKCVLSATVEDSGTARPFKVSFTANTATLVMSTSVDVSAFTLVLR